MDKMIKRMNVAGVFALSRRLMAIEMARVLGRQQVDAETRALELEARHLARGKTEKGRRL